MPLTIGWPQIGARRVCARGFSSGIATAVAMIQVNLLLDARGKPEDSLVIST